MNNISNNDSKGPDSGPINDFSLRLIKGRGEPRTLSDLQDLYPNLFPVGVVFDGDTDPVDEEGQ